MNEKEFFENEPAYPERAQSDSPAKKGKESSDSRRISSPFAKIKEFFTSTSRVYAGPAINRNTPASGVYAGPAPENQPTMMLVYASPSMMNKKQTGTPKPSLFTEKNNTPDDKHLI